MKPPRRIRQHHVRASGSGRGHRIKEHGCTVRPLPLGNHRNISASAPLLQLLRRCGAKGIPSGQQGTVPRGLEALSQLANGGGLTHAIHADHEDDEGLGGSKGKGRVALAQDFREHLRQLAHERIFIVQRPALHPRRQALKDRLGSLKAHVRREQLRFQRFQQAFVDFLPAKQKRAEGIPEGTPAPGETKAKTVKQPGAFPIIPFLALLRTVL